MQIDMLVSERWLSAHLDAPDLVVIDCTNFAEWDEAAGIYRTASGRQHWLEGHIEGSRHADFTRPGFAGDSSRFRNTLPEPAAFADAMAALGVHDGARVVLYDDAASMWACRVWWMLRWIGFDNAAVLDGGWLYWDDAGGRVSEIPRPHEPGELTHGHRPELFVDKAAVMAALDDPGTLLIDALSEAQFEGREESLGLKGHIPGAVNIPGASLVDPISEEFRPLEELAALFPEDRSQRTIVYCGSGVAAASVAFTMTRLGFDNVSTYMPGLQEWVTDPDAPLASG